MCGAGSGRAMTEVRSTPVCYTEKQAAQFLNVSISLLRKWRRLGAGPEFKKVGGKLVRYPIDSLRTWIMSQ
jgi:hypothetical protein